MASLFDNFVMATAPAQIPCPAIAARLLMVHMPPLHPGVLTHPVNTFFHAAEDMVIIIDKTMAGVESAIGVDPEIPNPSSTGIRIMGSPMQFLESRDHI
jgi:hypothetical protein